jgi:hypothetical protein
LSLAHALEAGLPGTRAAFRSGILNQRKAMIIASATALLDPAEARAAEAKVLDRAGALTPPGLRAAITPRGDGGRSGQGPAAPRARGEQDPGGAVGRAVR